MFRFILVVSISLFLIACATEPLKAPCDQDGRFCGTKIKINRWE